MQNTYSCSHTLSAKGALWLPLPCPAKILYNAHQWNSVGDAVKKLIKVTTKKTADPLLLLA